MIRLTDFEKKTSDPVGVEYLSSPSGNIPVYEIHSFHSLTQFIGFGKYLNREAGNVYLRGQTSLYDGTLPPSALRKRKNVKTGDIEPLNIEKRISDYKHNIALSLQNTKNFSNRDSNVMEPLLQHYGIRTYWLDIVDNVWIALWFALHRTASTIIDNREYVHVFESEQNQYAYVFLIGSDAIIESKKQPGLFEGKSSIVVDLRKAIPSYFLRPHAQHALMLKKKGSHFQFSDYSDMVIAIAKISVADGIKWIGQTGLMSVQSLFPPPYYDTG